MQLLHPDLGKGEHNNFSEKLPKTKYTSKIGLQAILICRRFFFLPECPPGGPLAMATAFISLCWAIKKSADLPRFLKDMIQSLRFPGPTVEGEATFSARLTSLKWLSKAIFVLSRLPLYSSSVSWSVKRDGPVLKQIEVFLFFLAISRTYQFSCPSRDLAVTIHICTNLT